jgi:arylsulfatase
MSRPDVAVVVLDTLRSDAFDRQFDWLPGLRFEHAFAPSHFTTPVHASLFTGRYPTEHAVRAKARQFDYPGPALAEQLSAAGYTTRGWSANPNVSTEYGFDRGFGEFRDAWKHDDFAAIFDWERHIHDTDPGAGRYLSGLAACLSADYRTVPSLRRGLDFKFDRERSPPDKGARSAVDAVRRLSPESPAFLFLNLMEVHSPYVAPEEYLDERVESLPFELTLAEEPINGERERAAYDACAAYLSDVYRELFGVLRDRFDYVITLSDHGHCFGEHGTVGHGYGMYPELTHVPLVVSGGPEGRSAAAVSLLDVHRTVLELAGVEPPEGARGVDLLAAPEPRPCLTEYHGLYDYRVAALLDAGYDEATVRAHDTELRGLATGTGYYGYQSRDGFVETGDEGRPDDPEGLLAETVAALDAREADAGDGDDGERSAALTARLEDLGYL